MDLGQVRQLSEGSRVAQGHEQQTVVGQGTQGRDGSSLLATTEGSSGDEKASMLAGVATAGPDATGLVPEGLIC